ncbi:MAG: alginate lyase family protein [Draconibacterium sp.]
MKTINLIIAIFFVFTGFVHAQKWQEIESVKDVCSAYPDQMKQMLDQFNLDYPGMEKVKTAYEKGDLEKACTELLNYYKSGNTAEYLRIEQPVKTNEIVAEADTILENIFTVQNVKGKVEYLPNGHRDWYYKGPNNDEEWAWLSNRHSQIMVVYSAYLKTGNPKYAEYINLFLRDFIIASWPYPGVKSGTSVWRGLEVAARVKVWSKLFYGLMNTDFLSPSTKLLILSSLPDHAHYNRYFHGQNNWLTMEISALATAATNFPEYKNSAEWLDYSIHTMTESMKGQIYPDGVQTELTSHYHIVALSNFNLFYEICKRANKELPDFYISMIEKMWDYLASTIRPNGTGLLNNDGDLDYNRDLILNQAKKVGNESWEYIASNGESGTKPDNGPSYFFPWAGHLISRSGFDSDAQWSFFDIGPWGSGHQHSDKLHISISAYGRDLLVDAGRFAYRGAVADKFRKYATRSQGHNIILIDGKGQAPGPLLAEEPLSDKDCEITGDYDYARGSFDKFQDVEGTCKHSRRMFYVRGDMWVVIDKITTDRPRKIEALWHFHPDCKVKQAGEIVTTDNDRGNLQVIPVGKQNWKIDFVKGQEEPEIQGWYSKEYNKYEPNTAAIYSANIEGDSEFIWVLFPSEKVVNDIKAEVVSKTENELKLKVYNSANDKWEVTVPL